jgi:WD40 repeat protein
MHVRVISATDGKPIFDLTGPADWVYAVDGHVGTKRIAGGSYDGRIHLWNLEDGKPISNWPAAPTPAAK